MFKFNFQSDDEESIKETKFQDEDKQPKDLKQSVKIEISPDQYAEIAENVKDFHLNCFISRDLEIGYLDNASLTDESDTDLIPKVYEGGFKVWECTQDLADFLSFDDKEFAGKRICDLGCSAGILGIIALISGAEKVDFQDFNEDVLEKFTIPNVILNVEEREKLEDFAKCAFYSGDWSNFKKLTIDDEKYDIILTSETIYNPENYEKLIDFFKTRIKNDGKVYLSAKSYYFGCDGNILDFCKVLEIDGTFDYKSLWQSPEGLQREILLLKVKKIEP